MSSGLCKNRVNPGPYERAQEAIPRRTHWGTAKGNVAHQLQPSLSPVLLFTFSSQKADIWWLSQNNRFTVGWKVTDEESFASQQTSCQPATHNDCYIFLYVMVFLYVCVGTWSTTKRSMSSPNLTLEGYKWDFSFFVCVWCMLHLVLTE